MRGDNCRPMLGSSPEVLRSCLALILHARRINGVPCPRLGFVRCRKRNDPARRSVHRPFRIGLPPDSRMTPVPVKILIVDRLGDQFLLTVRAESKKYKGKVDRLSFGAIHIIHVARTGDGMKTHTGVSRSVRLGTSVLLFVSSVSETLVGFAIFLLEPH